MIHSTADTLAVEGGTPVRARGWPTWPVFDRTEEEALLEVVRSGKWWSVEGTKVREFEAAFARFQDAQFAVCVTNGTAALEVALRAAHIGCGDEVIVPPYTFIATATAVLSVGATPVFVDVEEESLNIDPTKIEEAITPRTRAIIPVHIAGCPADMDGVLEVARKHNLLVIEDAAQAHAAEWKGTKVGAIGDMGCFSFQASKNLNAGEGGAVLTNDPHWADQVWSVHNVGRVRGGRWYEHHVLGSNFRMTEFQAAILLAQLQRLPEQTERRTQNARKLTEMLSQIPGIRPPRPDPRVTRHAYHLYIFRYDKSHFGGRPREDFLKALSAEGIPCTAGYVPLYKERVFLNRPISKDLCQLSTLKDYSKVHCPVCERACYEEAVWLYQNMLLGDEQDMADIATAVAKVQRAFTR
ncbi:MAG: DegT/DnrJ/EryC1/StrS family aminotransferase [Firmicutes bacterium]|nr:DegT/DnrJ/EryC1/StrS family aminotransferase [Bacillota bacterium]